MALEYRHVLALEFVVLMADEPKVTRKQFLALLQIFYQGLNLMASGVKRLIEEMK